MSRRDPIVRMRHMRDHDILWDTIRGDLPGLVEALERIAGIGAD